MENIYFFDARTKGQIFLMPKGVLLFDKIKELLRKKLQSLSYKEVYTPTFANNNFWEVTKHAEKFSENMFNIESDNKIKPMNCPMHILIFEKMIKNSQKPLIPIKLFEFNECFRKEKSGALNTLFRLNKFRQDDSHILCTLNDLEDVLENFINVLRVIYNIFGFYQLEFYLSTNIELPIQNKILFSAAKKIIKEEIIIQDGEGAFYGPKIDIKLKDKLNRSWQCGTFQLDFFTHKRLLGKSINENTVLIHHAILGTFERFIGIVLSNENNYLPFFLSFIKFFIIPIYICKETTKFIEEIQSSLTCYTNSKEEIIIENSKAHIAKKIKKAILSKSFFILFIGEKETKTKTISFKIKSDDMTINLNVVDFLNLIKTYNF